MNTNITILIADNFTLVREAWHSMLNSVPGFQVIAETGNAEEVVELARRFKPDVVILDIQLESAKGIDAISLLRQYSPYSKILSVSMDAKPANIRKMRQSGAKGCITWNSSSVEMFKAIVEIKEGRTYISEEIKTGLAEMMILAKESKVGINSLSQRELEVIEHIKAGKSSKEIAKELNIARRTIEVHRYNIKKKLGLKNVAAIVNYFNTHHFNETINWDRA